MKRVVCIILAAVMVLSFGACSKEEEESSSRKKKDKDTGTSTTTIVCTACGEKLSKTDSFCSGCGAVVGNKPSAQPQETVKVGFIYLGDENAVFNKPLIDAANAVCAELGVDKAEKWLVAESEACYDAARELIEIDGCNVIFGMSYGYESYLIQAAKDYPNVQFCHASGVQAHTVELSNFQNVYASIYEGRYLTGVAAGMKLKSMIDSGEITAAQAKIGYVGSFAYAEVISDYTAFFLGVRSVVPSATMEVLFTSTWYDVKTEYQAANTLIDDGCVLLSQHSCSLGAPVACESAGVPNVAYTTFNVTTCPNTFLVSAGIDWAPYLRYMITCVSEGRDIATDWVGSFNTGSVVLSEFGQQVAPGTAERVADVKQKLQEGELHVFDTDTFTVSGVKLRAYLADVDQDMDFEPDTEVIEGGVFRECKYRSAPYFSIEIDGIVLRNRAY